MQDIFTVHKAACVTNCLHNFSWCYTYFRLESANKHLEVQLAQISQQKYQEIQSTNKSLSEYEAQNEAVRFIAYTQHVLLILVFL